MTTPLERFQTLNAASNAYNSIDTGAMLLETDAVRMNLVNLPENPAERREALVAIGARITTLKQNNRQLMDAHHQLAQATHAQLRKLQDFDETLTIRQRTIIRLEESHFDRSASCCQKAFKRVANFASSAGNFTVRLADAIVSPLTSCCRRRQHQA